MTTSPEEGPLGWLERALDDATPEQLAQAGLADEATRAELRADLRALGLFGTIAVLAATDLEGDPQVAAEAPEAVARELAAVVGDGAPADLRGLAAAYAALKGERGRDLVRKVVGRTLHDLYDLEAHGLTADDAARALDLVSRGKAERDARDLARSLARLSRLAARTVLGHLEGQLHLVHRLANEELMPSEIDGPLREFAPRIFARRVPSMVKVLLPKEARLRLAVVLWGRFRGISVGRDNLVRALDGLTLEKPLTLAAALASPAVAPRRRAYARAETGAASAHALEEIGEDLTGLSG